MKRHKVDYWAELYDSYASWLRSKYLSLESPRLKGEVLSHLENLASELEKNGGNSLLLSQQARNELLPQKHLGKIRKDYPEILQKLRTDYGYSQSDVASGAHISHRTYWRLERGGSGNPTRRSIEAIASFFGVPLATFYEGVNKSSSKTE